MTQDSWPPVASKPAPSRPSLIRWAWIPILLAIPTAVWGASQTLQSKPPAPSPAPTEALEELSQLTHNAKASPPNTNVPSIDPKNAGDEDVVDDSVDTGTDDTVDNDVDDGVDDTVNEGVDDTVDDGVDDGSEDGADDGAHGEFWIQVASLPLKEKADRLAAQLRKKGHKAQTLAYGGPRAGWWHVVRLGPYPTRIDAESARLDFVRSEPMSTVVMPRARGPYHIQIASLRSESGAKNLAARLARRGHAAVARSVSMGKNGTWYTVRVGPFDSVRDAEDYQKLLEQHDNVQGEIVPRPPPDATPARDQDPASL